MSDGARTIRLEIESVDDMVDLVRVVTDYIGRTAGLDDDAVHWFGMAVRECVVNAITHGNGGNSRTIVSIAFTMTPASNPTEIAVCVRDQGKGFDPNALLDPLAPENALRTTGRGVFLMCQLMDDVSVRPSGEGGTEVRMIKRIRRAQEQPPE